MRVRRAMALAIDPWKGAPALSKIATVHTVGGLVFPGSPLAATKEELQKIVGFGTDIEKARAEARKLLFKEAGAEGLKFELTQPQRRSALQVHRHLGDRRVEQDRPEGEQRVPADRSVFSQALRGGTFEVAVEVQLPEHGQTRCSMSAVLPRSVYPEGYGGYETRS